MYMQNRNSLTDIENKLVITNGEGRRKGKIRGMGLTDMNYYT